MTTVLALRHAAVRPMGHREIGFAPVALSEAGAASCLAALADGGEPVPVLHWHGNQFDTPPGARHLAASALCPNQPFAVGTHALGRVFTQWLDAALPSQR